MLTTDRNLFSSFERRINGQGICDYEGSEESFWWDFAVGLALGNGSAIMFEFLPIVRFP
jgi:hypothetical protein